MCARRRWGSNARSPDGIRATPTKARKRFFLKKEAKTFAPLSRAPQQARDSKAKVFWFFFSKKNPSLTLRESS
jgi:hypothetical protein